MEKLSSNVLNQIVSEAFSEQQRGNYDKSNELAMQVFDYVESNYTDFKESEANVLLARALN